ncbi:MAG TPA: NRDE family protein [Fulvivirga sp.]|nr:NRDE family protein [Fulvivirga sp.]
MCLILLGYKVHPTYKLIIAANRDEFYGRPTKPLDFWEEDRSILAGKDLEAGGTWLGLTTAGKISLLTNYRDLKNIKPNAPSRGHLVSDYLKKGIDASQYLENVAQKGNNYNGFNIICGDVDELQYYGNYQKGVHKIKAGVHGLSNALFNTPWPKVIKGKEKVEKVIANNEITAEHLFATLYDDLKAPDNQLPDTGVGYEKEAMLSPMFIKSENYGSRCSTVILVDNDNNVHCSERTYNPHDYSYETKSFDFKAK